MKVKKVIFITVVLWAIGLISIFYGTQAKDLGPTYDRQPHITTTYDRRYRVFCATRLNAVSCVHIPEYIKEK